MSLRRYEILLPRRFNDGRAVPSGLLREAVLELRERFGAVSSETQMIRGQWQHQGEVYHDELVRVFVDVPDLPEHMQFFLEYKERLKSRFQQIDIWISSHEIQIL